MFYVKIATPLKKFIPLFPIKPPLKIEVLSSPPPSFENLVGRSTPLSRREGVHTMLSQCNVDIYCAGNMLEGQISLDKYGKEMPL